MTARDRFQKAAARIDEVLKHYGAGDHRHPSATHGPKDTQKPHGNRPGERTQSTILEAAEVKPDGFDDAPAVAQLDYFLRAAGRATPVVQAGDQFWLAPPSAVMLEERGAGENISASDAPEANTNFAEGLSDVDKLELPAPAESEEGKRFLEAAAEHRQNDYKGPTTPRFEEMFGDALRSAHPARAPKTYGGRLTPQAQQAVARAAVKAKKKGLPLQKMQAISAFVNVLGTQPTTGPAMDFIGDLVNALALGPQDVPGRRSTGSTAEPATEAEATAEGNAERQDERAEDQREATEERAQQRRRRLPQRFPTS